MVNLTSVNTKALFYFFIIITIISTKNFIFLVSLFNDMATFLFLISAMCLRALKSLQCYNMIDIKSDSQLESTGGFLIKAQLSRHLPAQN